LTYSQVKRSTIHKTAYIAGPYRAKTKLGVILNIWRARKVAKKYWKLGYAVFCPHLNSCLMDGTVTDENFLKADLKFLECSDLVVMIHEWEKSEGSKSEFWLAKRLGKEIIME